MYLCKFCEDKKKKLRLGIIILSLLSTILLLLIPRVKTLYLYQLDVKQILPNCGTLFTENLQFFL